MLVSAEVVPFRPHRGVYLFVEQASEITTSPSEDGLGRLPAGVLADLVDVPGVAGAWVYATSPDLRRSMFTDGILRVTTCYLDEEPVTVAHRLASILDRVWDVVPTRLLLAAPFESIVRWDWEGAATTAT